MSKANKMSDPRGPNNNLTKPNILDKVLQPHKGLGPPIGSDILFALDIFSYLSVACF